MLFGFVDTDPKFLSIFYLPKISQSKIIDAFESLANPNDKGFEYQKV